MDRLDSLAQSTILYDTLCMPVRPIVPISAMLHFGRLCITTQMFCHPTALSYFPNHTTFLNTKLSHRFAFHTGIPSTPPVTRAKHAPLDMRVFLCSSAGFSISIVLERSRRSSQVFEYSEPPDPCLSRTRPRPDACDRPCAHWVVVATTYPNMDSNLASYVLHRCSPDPCII